jgi:threonine dehydrogenase-like Zn-dependent dehydrogenase
MKAVIKATEQAGSLQVAEIDTPKPDAQQVLVRVKAASLCGTDISILDNKYIGRRPVPIPLVLGHGGAGIIAELGSRVTSHAVGDRVALEPISGCGSCYQCRMGFKNLCLEWEHIGITCPGVFAEYVTVPANNAHKIADGVDFSEAALIESLGLVVRSLEQSKPMLGETVAIIGPGPLGMMHLLAYKGAGASTVIMVGLEQDRQLLEIAGKLGADHVVNLDEQDPLEATLSLTNDLGADIVVETASSPKATKMAFDLAAPRGRVVLFGLYPEASFSQVQMLRKGLTVYGDVGQVTRHFLRAINWVETGKVSLGGMISKTFSLDEASHAFEAKKQRGVVNVVFEL